MRFLALLVAYAPRPVPWLLIAALDFATRHGWISERAALRVFSVKDRRLRERLARMGCHEILAKLPPLLLIFGFTLPLTACASVNTVVRDPKTGQTESCRVTFYLTMNASGRCTDGSTTMEVKTVKGKTESVGRDRFGRVVTCGPEFNGAMCWPSSEHYKPPAAGWEGHE